jgi:hypothetical protein
MREGVAHGFKFSLRRSFSVQPKLMPGQHCQVKTFVRDKTGGANVYFCWPRFVQMIREQGSSVGAACCDMKLAKTGRASASRSSLSSKVSANLRPEKETARRRQITQAIAVSEKT